MANKAICLGANDMGDFKESSRTTEKDMAVMWMIEVRQRIPMGTKTLPNSFEKDLGQVILISNLIQVSLGFLFHT